MSRNQRDRAHWAKRKKEIDQWALMIPQCHDPQQEGERRLVEVIFRKNSGPASDEDNMVARCKVILDALTRRGWIADDSPKWISLEVREERGPTTTIIGVSEEEKKPWREVAT
jgi:predicted nucleic acid-binding Zn ribbon protein